MKKLTLLVVAILLLTGFVANAQNPKMKKQKQTHCMKMQEGGMMGQMPMKKYMMIVNKLPGMKADLSLTQEQTDKLIDLQTEFKKNQVELKGEMKKQKMALQKLLDQNASTDKVKSQLEKCTDIHVNMMMSAYETANKMKSLLSDTQKQKLEKIMSSNTCTTEENTPNSTN